MAMVAHGRVDLTPLLTHHFALDDIETAFDLFSSQRDGVLKVALHPRMPKADREPQLTGVGAVDSEC